MYPSMLSVSATEVSTTFQSTFRMPSLRARLAFKLELVLGAAPTLCLLSSAQISWLRALIWAESVVT